MTDSELLKLIALDDEDLAVVSAYVQDGILKVGDLVYLPKEGRFVVPMNRFIWEKANGRRRSFERRRSALTFDRVRSVQTTGIQRDKPDTVLELLAVSFEATDEPAGHVLLVFAGGGAIRLTVECIEARIADLGPAWATTAMPRHDLSPDKAAAGA